jgi:tRNA(Ile)-lysidine synthase
VFPSLFTQNIMARLDELTVLACPDVPDPGLLVGLSGGPDSVVLLLAAKTWAQDRNRQIAAAHLNHRLRGSEADSDAAFCADLCEKLGLRFFLREDDPRPLARSRGAGVEEAARVLRHDFFQTILAENHDLHCVATGHHRDDQVETVIMRLFRGTGPDGMAGIRPVSSSVIHPLLHLTRSEILVWLEEQGQPWRTDASNRDGDNTRSRLRRELLPLVRSIFGEGASSNPARLADLWENDLSLLERMTSQSLAELGEEPPGTSGLPVDKLLALHPGLAGRNLRRWLTAHQGIDPSRLESVHLMNILAWLREGVSGTALDLPGGFRLTRDFNSLRVMNTNEKSAPMRNAGDFRILVSKVDTPKDPESYGRAEGNGEQTGPETWNLTTPSAVLKGNLRVRNWRQGDRLQPLGLDGTRKLSDLFREQRIATAERPDVLVVEDDEGIIWVVGLARAERTRLLKPGEPTVIVTVAPRGSHTDKSVI